MTNKKTLINKLWNGAKKVAQVGAIATIGYLALNPSNAYSQKKVQFKEGQTVQIKDPHGGVTQAPVLNIHGIYYFEVKDENNGDSKLWVAETCPRVYSYGNNEPTYTKGLVLKEQSAKYNDKKDGSEKSVGELKLNPKGSLGIDGPKMNELIQKEVASSNLGVTNMSDKGRVTGIYTIDLEGKACFVPYISNQTIEKLALEGISPDQVADFIRLPVKDEKGVYTDQAITPYGNVSLGNANDGIIYVVDSTESVKDYLATDSLKKFLRIQGYPGNSVISDLKQTGEAVDFGEWEEKEATKEAKEKKSDIEGRVKIGAFYTIPNGFEGSINPQLKVSDKAYVGINGFYSTLTKKTSNASHEDGFTQLVNAPLDMYFVNTGADINENIVNKLSYGAGATFSYVGGNWEINAEAGVVKQNVENTMTSEGEEYMTINGVKDSSSVTPYNETNVLQSDALPAYVKIGGEWYPFSNGTLKNVSVAGDFGYVFGENSTSFGKIGLKYTFGNKDKAEENTQ